MVDTTKKSVERLMQLLQAAAEKTIELPEGSDAKKDFESKVKAATKKYWLNYFKETGLFLSKTAILELIAKLPLISVLYATTSATGSMTVQAQVGLVINTIKSEADAINKTLNMPALVARCLTLLKGRGIAASNVASRNVFAQFAPAMPVLHALSIFTSILSIVVAGYELKNAVNEKKSLVELKSTIDGAMNEFLKDVINDSGITDALYKGTVSLDINKETNRGQAKKILKQYFGKYEDLGAQNLAKLIGKLSPDSITDKPYLEAAQNAMIHMLNKIAEPQREQVAKAVSELIAFSALERAQRKIAKASSKQEIIIVLKSLSLILAVAGFAAASVATFGILPATAGLALVGVGVILAIAIGLNGSAGDKNKAIDAYESSRNPVRFFDLNHTATAANATVTGPSLEQGDRSSLAVVCV